MTGHRRRLGADVIDCCTVPWITDSLLTDRLVLRAFRETDKPVIVELVTDEDVRRHLGGPVGNETVEAIRDHPVGETWGSFCIADAETDEALGLCSFGRDRDELELSYQLIPARWGQGIALEATRAALQWAWANTEDATVIAVTQTANARSLGLLGRLGFVEGDRFVEFGEPQTLLRLHRPAVE